MSIDWESLLEIENSLANNPSFILENLDNIIDYNQLNNPTPSTATDFTQQDLDDLLSTCNDNVHDKTTQNLSELENSYYLALLSNSTNAVSTLPKYTKYLFTRGVPQNLRARVWSTLTTASDSHGASQEEFSSIFDNFHNQQSHHTYQISKDLLRTFPNIPFFSEPSTIKNLTSILNAFANYDIEIGYCQGLLFLAGPIYHTTSDAKLSFITMLKILEINKIRNFFNSQLSGLSSYIVQFNTIFQKQLPKLYAHFEDLGVETTGFFTQWVLSFMGVNCSFELLVRLFDIFMVEGFKDSILKCALFVLSINEEKLLDLDMDEVYSVLLRGKFDIVEDIDLFIVELSEYDVDLADCSDGNTKTLGENIVNTHNHIIDTLNYGFWHLFKWETPPANGESTTTSSVTPSICEKENENDNKELEKNSDVDKESLFSSMSLKDDSCSSLNTSIPMSASTVPPLRNSIYSLNSNNKKFRNSVISIDSISTSNDSLLFNGCIKEEKLVEEITHTRSRSNSKSSLSKNNPRSRTSLSNSIEEENEEEQDIEEIKEIDSLRYENVVLKNYLKKHLSTLQFEELKELGIEFQ